MMRAFPRPCTQTSLQAHLVAWSRQWQNSNGDKVWESLHVVQCPTYKMSFDQGAPKITCLSLRGLLLG